MPKMWSAAAFMLMIAALAGLILTRSVMSRSALVVGLQIAAVTLMLWARVTLGWRSFHATADPKEGALVTRGPYHFVRHPIYAAICLFVWACVLGHPSLANSLFALLATIGAAVRTALEEQLLRQRYPAYNVYSTATKRIVPYLF